MVRVECGSCKGQGVLGADAVVIVPRKQVLSGEQVADPICPACGGEKTIEIGSPRVQGPQNPATMQPPTRRR